VTSLASSNNSNNKTISRKVLSETPATLASARQSIARHDGPGRDEIHAGGSDSLDFTAIR
jgi:hypothetical protein